MQVNSYGGPPTNETTARTYNKTCKSIVAVDQLFDNLQGEEATKGILLLDHMPLNCICLCSALGQSIAWAEENGVVDVALKLNEWVLTNVAHQSFTDRSLSVKLTECSVLLKHTESDLEYVFNDIKALRIPSV